MLTCQRHLPIPDHARHKQSLNVASVITYCRQFPSPEPRAFSQPASPLRSQQHDYRPTLEGPLEPLDQRYFPRKLSAMPHNYIPWGEPQWSSVAVCRVVS